MLWNKTSLSLFLKKKATMRKYILIEILKWQNNYMNYTTTNNYFKDIILSEI